MTQTVDTETPNKKPRLNRLVRIAALVCIGYLGIVLMLLFLENKLLYHPIPHTAGWMAPPGQLRVEDVTMATADGINIHGWWCPVDDSPGALIYAHGNAGNLSHRGTAIAKLQQALGLSVLIFDYPGYGRSEGKPSEAGCYAAADAAYDWLSRKVPAGQIVLYGKSLGGGVMVDVAARRPHRVLVLAKTFTSIPDMAQQSFPFLPARWLVRNRFDSLAKIGRCPQPIFVAHGDADRLIPFSQGKNLYEAAPEPKQFCLMPGCDHNDAHPPVFYASLKEFLKRHEGGLVEAVDGAAGKIVE